MPVIFLSFLLSLTGQTGDVVSPIVDTASVQRTLPQALTSVAATSGSTASATFAMPFGYDSLLVYAGDFPVARDKLILYVKVDSTTTPVHLYPYGCVCVKGISGKTISFGSQTVDKATNTTTSESVTVKVLPHIAKSLRGPPSATAVTGTITVDHGPPDQFVATRAQFTFQDEFSVFTIASASISRDVFLIESDGLNDTPPRHLHLPANQTIAVACRYKYAAIFSPSQDITTLDVTCPAKTTLDTSSPGYYWEPDFTASKTINVAAGDVAGFKTAMNDASDNVDIVMEAGSYDVSGASYQIKTANYGTAITKNRRIRSASGNQDVVFNFGADINLTSGKSWIIKGVNWSCDGVAVPSGKNAHVSLQGVVNLINCTVYGVTSSSGDYGLVTWDTNSSTGPVTAYAAWCTFQKSARDCVACNVNNSQACTTHLIGCTVDGNGPQASNNDQLITPHFGGSIIAWGCRLKDAATGNPARITGDNSTSSVHLNYCYSRVGDITNATGLTLSGVSPNSNYLLFCDLQKIHTFNNAQTVVGTTLKTAVSGNPMTYASTNTRFVGCDIYGPSSGAGQEQIIDAIDSNVELFACRLTMTSTTQTSGMIRMYKTTGGPYTGKVTNCTIHAPASTATPAFSIATANELMTIKNCVFGGLGQYTISGSADQTSTIAGSYLQKKTNTSTAPSNWDARFSATPWASLGTSVKSASDPPLDANDVPIASGACDGGVDPGIVGSTDIYGRPYLGGTFLMGAVERQEIRSNAFLYPMIWSQ